MKQKLLRILLSLLLVTTFFGGPSNYAFARITVGENENLLADIKVTGKVTDNAGEPLPGVTVLLKGTTKGTATDVNGVYNITAPAEATLEFSYIGYTTQEISIKGRTTINVQLVPSAKSLEEVVVVGYGTKKKKDLTGSVTTISTEDFNQGPMTTPEQLISGKVAGVQITSNGGSPGSGSQIRIRGGASLNANNEPLIVLDGVPLESSTYNKVEGGKITSISSISGQENPLSFINPNDIESFNILKDASATAIYGSRASNGVIIITTKKGKEGQQPRITFSSILSVPQRIGAVNVLNADQFRQVVTEQVAAGSINASQETLLGSVNTNWQDQVYKSPMSADNNIGINGAFKKMPYRFSFGYLSNDGILKTSTLDRTSASIALGPSFFDDHLKVDFNVKGAISKSRFADKGAIGAAVAFDPTQPVYTDNPPLGNYLEWLDPATGQLWTLGTRNPLSMLEQKNDKGDVKRSIGNVQLDYKFHFLPELRANLNLGYDISQSDGFTIVAPTAGIAYYDQGTDKNYSQSKTNKLLEFYLNYGRNLESVQSRFDVTGGYSYQDFYRNEPQAVTVKGTGLNDTIAPFKTQNTLISFFGRLNYTFKDRYLLTATVRRDGSSRFSPDNRWGTFPSVALAWRILEEPFMKDSKLFSDLKLRIGYGVTGQQDVLGDYPYLPRYTFSDPTANYQIGSVFYTTLRPEGYDSNIKWEETTTYNAGVDFGFMKGKISGSLDYYYKKTKDLLSIIPVPAGSNLTNQILTNVGNIENQGVELALNAIPVSKQNFTWSLGFNATYNNNKITNLSKVNDPAYQGVLVGSIAGGVGNTIQIHSVGYPTYSFYVLKQVYDQNGKPVEGVYVDLNGDGVINDNDRYRYKSPNPKFILGFNSQFNYKQWNLSFVMRANIGNYMYNNFSSNNGAYQAFSFSNYLANLSTSVLQTNFRQFQLFSDYYVENASFLKMDDLRLGYDLSKILKNKFNLIISADVQNVFIITNYSGLDPEIVGGIDNNFYPRSRVYSLGVNFSF